VTAHPAVQVDLVGTLLASARAVAGTWARARADYQRLRRLLDAVSLEDTDDQLVLVGRRRLDALHDTIELQADPVAAKELRESREMASRGELLSHEEVLAALRASRV
jgi:PHD/YefM family antitoxin component YafN of YafNO toxin-antitoxin module